MRTMSQFAVDYINNTFTETNPDVSNYDQSNNEPFARATFQESLSSQQVTQITRDFTSNERLIIDEIDKCFSTWYEPWKQSYLDGGSKFGAVYDLMEGLIHYESQIKGSRFELASERLSAIAKAVARLIDYGNAILDIDIVIRSNDGSFHELDPTNMTTIELYAAHIKAQKLRKKLLDNYFRKSQQDISEVNSLTASNSPSSSTLRVPQSNSWNFPSSPTMDRSQRFSVGSNASINTLGPTNSSGSDGRRTPQTLSSSQIEIRTMSSTEDLTEGQLEMRHMVATIRSEVFSDSKNTQTRCTLMLGVLAKVDSLLTMPANTEKLTNCFDLLDALLDTVERLPTECRRDEVRLIARSMLKTLVRKVFIDDRDSCVEFQHAYWTTYLLSLVRMMSAADYEAYFKTFSSATDLSIFLRDYLFIVKRLFSSHPHDDTSQAAMDDSNGQPVYPNCWIEMSLLACQTFLSSLMSLYQILRNHFNSNTQMWQSYLECLVHFLLQDVLHRDKLLPKERQRQVANDLRKTAAEYVWITWDVLKTDQRYGVLEDLIKPMLKVCMQLCTRQRSILLPIFHDMMQCDFSSQYMSTRGTICNSGSSGFQFDNQSCLSYEDKSNAAAQNSNNGIYLTPPTIYNDNENLDESLPYLSFRDPQSMTGFNSSSGGNEDGTVLTKFTHLAIEKLYTLMIDQDLGDDQFRIELCAVIGGTLDEKYRHNKNFASESLAGFDLGQFKSMARHTSELIDEFMQICLDLRQANRLSFNHLRLLCLFKLILFFRDKVSKPELYLSNLHKLWRLHHGASRYVEAGFTLLEHAKSLPWINRPLESHYRIMTRSFQSPVTDYLSLKLSLYTTIIEYFDQGQLWEAAVPLCRELVDIYQFILYDYEKLAQVLARLSTFFGNISSGQLRSQPEYFRVSFYGVGFPASLQGTTVIYRGKPYEKLSDFSAALLSKYPDARLLKTLSQPDESILQEPDAKYLQVNACAPIVDLKSKLEPSMSASSLFQQSAKPVDVNEIQESILSYYKFNECDKFEFSRRIAPPNVSANDSNRLNDDSFANMWRQRVILTTNSLPGMLPFFPVFLTETKTISPIECAIEDLERANDRLVCMVNRFRADKHCAEDVRPLGQLLLGIVDAAVNGGITKYEQAFFNDNIIIKQAAHINNVLELEQNNANSNQLTTETGDPSDHQTQRAPPPTPTSDAFRLGNTSAESTTGRASTVSILGHKHGQAPVNNNSHQPPTSGQVPERCAHEVELPAGPTFSQLEKLKCLIARQVPLLDEAIMLHRGRVADVMRPQHEHLETSFKRLRNHVVSKYYRYLDKTDYNRSTNSSRSFRSFARSPNRSIRSESRISLALSSGANSAATSGRFGRKRLSDVGGDRRGEQDYQRQMADPDAAEEGPKPSSIPYKQLINERRSLPFLSGLQNLSLADRQREQADSCVASTVNTTNENGQSAAPINLQPPPLPSRQTRALASAAPLPSSAFYQRNSDDDQAAGNDYVCLTDVMQAIGGRKESNPYVRLSPDSDEEPNSLGREPDIEGKKEPPLVTY